MDKIRKAIVAGLAAFGATLAGAATSGHLDWPTLGVSIGAGVTAGWVAWRVPNALPPVTK